MQDIINQFMETDMQQPPAIPDQKRELEHDV